MQDKRLTTLKFTVHNCFTEFRIPVIGLLLQYILKEDEAATVFECCTVINLADSVLR